MKSSVIVEVLRVDTIINFDGTHSKEYTVVKTFDYTNGFSSADIAEQARLACKQLNVDHGNYYREYITNNKS